MMFGLTTRPVYAAAVAAGALRMLPWAATHRDMARIGLDAPGAACGATVLIHGGLGWGEAEARLAERMGMDESACGQVVARARVAAVAQRAGGVRIVAGDRPSWGPADADALIGEWPGDAAQVLVLDAIERVEPTPAMGNLAGPWTVSSALADRLRLATGVEPAPGRVLPAEGPAGRALAPRSPATPATLERAFADAAAQAGLVGWGIAEVLPPFADGWITEMGPRAADGQLAPGPAVTVERRGDPSAQAAELVALAARIAAWWPSALDALCDRPAPGVVIGCDVCEAPAALRRTAGPTVLIEGAGFITEIGRPTGIIACSRGRGGRGCEHLVDHPVVCSTRCERAALAAAGRPTTTATAPAGVVAARALDQSRLWRAAGDRAYAARRGILISLALGEALPQPPGAQPIAGMPIAPPTPVISYPQGELF